MIEPEGFHNWNIAMRGAYRKGFLAFSSGEPRQSPYKDKRKPDGRLTWSRAFESAWLDGWDAANSVAKSRIG